MSAMTHIVLLMRCRRLFWVPSPVCATRLASTQNIIAMIINIDCDHSNNYYCYHQYGPISLFFFYFFSFMLSTISRIIFISLETMLMIRLIRHDPSLQHIYIYIYMYVACQE